MRENRTYGSEGGAAELNRPSLPLLDWRPSGQRRERFYVVVFKYLSSCNLCFRVAMTISGLPADGLSL